MKQQLIKIGVMAGLALSTATVFTSCDDDDKKKAAAAAGFSFPTTTSSVSPGSVFSANVEANESISFNVSSINVASANVASNRASTQTDIIPTADPVITGTGVLTIERNGILYTYSGLNFTYDTSGSSPVLILQDNRADASSVLVALENLFKSGGPVETEFLAAVADDTEANLELLVNAVTAQTQAFAVDYDDETYAFRVTSLYFYAGRNEMEVRGDRIEGSTADGLSFTDSTSSTEAASALTFSPASVDQ